jgi:hypothetical protein
MTLKSTIYATSCLSVISLKSGFGFPANLHLVSELVSTNEPDFLLDISMIGARGSVVVKALCYKPEGRGFDSR